MNIIQLTDTHLFASPDGNLRGLNTANSLARVVDLAKTLAPDLVLVTGDLSQDETPASYDRLQRLLEPLEVPIYYLLGNHDNPEAMRQVWNTVDASQPQVIRHDDWQLLLLNSRVPGQVQGRLSADSLDWLEAQLQHCANPALIALHHPPIAPDDHWEPIVLDNANALYQVIDRHPQVRLVLSGHIHQPLHYQRGAVAFLTAPSTCLQYHLPKQSALDDHHPGLRLVELYPDGNWLTRVTRVSL